MRATSVLANAKSEAHQDASSRAAWHERKAHVLTQGDLWGESNTGVSRGHSSKEAMQKHGGAKGRRNDCKATREPVNRAKRVQTSEARNEQSQRAVRTRSAPMVKPSQAARGETIRRSCGTQGRR